MAGEPYPSPQRLHDLLRQSLAQRLPRVPALRVIRVAGPRAIVEVPHTALLTARTAWNGQLGGTSGGSVGVTTRRTWGTLVKAKAWLRSRPPTPRDPRTLAR
ncbi:MAG TPA: hypothetical protein VGV89_02730 [Thermoplasmata archaeon]|nr:hypothetical protein [Thermoplasmata archaeon]